MSAAHWRVTFEAGHNLNKERNYKMDKRLHALFIIGSDTLPNNRLTEVLDKINSRYGGCTVHIGTGYWSESGNQDLSVYDRVKSERAIQIEVCTNVQDFDMEYLQRAFIPAKGYAQWIHCEVWQTFGNHFNINEL